MNAKDDPPLDDASLELLAAYADGTLAPDDRRAAESLLARSDAAREVLAETIRLVDVGDSGTAAPRPGGRLAAAHRYRRVWRLGLPLAAAAAIVLYITRPADSTASEDVRSLLPGSTVTEVAGWDVKPWSNVRGEGLNSIRAASFRAGVLWTDYLTSAGTDTVAARRATADILALLEEIPLSSPATIAVRELQPSRADALQLRATEEALCDTTDCDLFRAGVWLEATRLWSVSGADLAAVRQLRAGIRSLETVSSADVRPLLERLDAELDRPAPVADSVVTIVNFAIRTLSR